MRVLLVNPPSPERLGSPLLGQQYVASALLAAGHEVRVADAAARAGPGSDAVLAAADDFRPDVVGVGLFTRWVHHAYRLVEALADRGGFTLVAGGAHATVRPEETLSLGFDVALRGEAEKSFIRLLAALEGGGRVEEVPGAVFRAPDGAIRRGPPPKPIDDLDGLAPPHRAQPLYDPAWYDAGGGPVSPGGILTSRGCPARCTFCANHVTGRVFRYRSAPEVVDEILVWHRDHGVTFFPFWDDAFTVNTRRLLELCREFERRLDFPFGFSAITRANLVTPEILAAMKRAGAVHVNFGVESGDDAVLAAIRKGIRTDHVVRALEWAKEIGLRTAANFMLGFPGETEASLAKTLGFMERIAPLVDSFSTLGVVVPFPGTPIYDLHHEEYGFTDWWLREDHSRYAPPPPVEDREAFYRYYTDDANLDLDFFRYDEGTRDAIRACLRFKAERNLRAMGLLPDPVHRPEPAETR